MAETLVQRLRDIVTCGCDEDAAVVVGNEAAAEIERLRRLLHKYGDRIPLATNARPDWQQEIDEAMEWVANNPDDSGVRHGG